MVRRFTRLQAAATALPVLESAVRLLSFTRAGAELGLTQPTVSRHIQSLEEVLGVSLFTRNNNRINPTAAARDLAAGIDFGFAHVEETLVRLGRANHPTEARLCCGFGFANLWMMPRFSDLRRCLGEHRISLTVSFWMENVQHTEFDVIVDWMATDWRDWSRKVLFEETVYPVATREVAARFGLTAEAPEALIGAPLLQFDERPPTAGWSTWFDSVGLQEPSPQDRYHHSSYQFMLQSLLDGEGVGLGWHHLVADHIGRGRLVRVGPVLKSNTLSLCVATRNSALPDPLASLLVAWFEEEVRKMAIVA